MAEQFLMSREIVEEHYSRMMHIRKYYPFFKLADGSLLQFRDGKYADLDMGYITMAVLRFFIEENNFKEKDVTYEEIEEFLGEIYRRDFDLSLDYDEEHELSTYIFDKIKNDGKPFSFSCFDPAMHVKKQMRIRLVEGRMEGDTIYYSITTDGLEFYLDTKELQDESTISIEQLLLEKMIRSRNFKGGAEVVRRINNEVKKLQLQKNEVLSLLGQNLFEGINACQEFMDKTVGWFDEEQKLFEKNSELIRMALSQARKDEQARDYNSQYYKAMEEIYTLEAELNRALQKHSELLTACMEMQNTADDLVTKAKLRSLRTSFDFDRMGQAFIMQERADKFAAFVLPLLKPKINKTFALKMVDELLSFRPENGEAAEKIVEEETKEYVFDDEIEESRIKNNFFCFINAMFELLITDKQFNLDRYLKYLQRLYGQDIVKSSDLYTFLVHLCQKKEYNTAVLLDEKDTFLEGVMAEYLKAHPDNIKRYGELHFTLKMNTDRTIVLDDYLNQEKDGSPDCEKKADGELGELSCTEVTDFEVI